MNTIIMCNDDNKKSKETKTTNKIAMNLMLNKSWHLKNKILLFGWRINYHAVALSLAANFLNSRNIFPSSRHALIKSVNIFVLLADNKHSKRVKAKSEPANNLPAPLFTFLSCLPTENKTEIFVQTLLKLRSHDERVDCKFNTLRC